VPKPLPDHVDEIVAQWQRERPDLDTAALAILGRLFRAAHLADGALARGLAGFHQPPGWFDLLAALRRAGAPFELTPTQLMRTTLLSSGGMTKRLDRLVEAGLVKRRPDPDDRRGTRVRLTKKGRAAIEAAIEVHVSNENGLLHPLTSAERRALDESLRRLLVSLEERTRSSGRPVRGAQAGFRAMDTTNAVSPVGSSSQ
jgi:DNA-binding MarR family transcriptional regulator